MQVDVVDAVTERTGYEVEWYEAEGHEEAQAERIHSMLSDSLRLDTAIQVALLNNRHLQAVYESVGIAGADLWQAGLFENPSLDIHVGYPVEEGHSPDLGFSVAFNFLDAFHVPLRKAVAQSRVEEMMLDVSHEVISFTGDVQQAFYAYQAARQKEELMNQIVSFSAAAYEASGLLREAGIFKQSIWITSRHFTSKHD